MSTTAQQSGEWINLPGFTEVLRHEKAVRARAFAPVDTTLRVAGELVRPLTLSLLLDLEGRRVAFINPWKFDSGLEMAAECARFIWHISEERQKCRWYGWAFSRFLSRVALHPDALAELRAYLEDAMYDAPFAPDGAESPRVFVHWAAAVLDLLGAAGSVMSRDQIFSMPLAQLWQLYRLAAARHNESPLTNPSDIWAAKEIERINDERRRTRT